MQLLQQLQWDSLEQRRLHNRLGMLYRTYNGLVDINPSTAVLTSGPEAPTGCAGACLPPRSEPLFVPLTISD
jgi:hypothetical protein